MKETQVHLDAFELYYSMKASRSYKKVAEQVGISERNVSEWGKVFAWQERVRERDKKIAEGVAEEVIKQEIDIKVKILNAIGKTVDKYTEKLQQGSISLETVKDLDIMGRLWKELEGQVETVNPQPQGVNGFTFNLEGKPKEEDGDINEN